MPIDRRALLALVAASPALSRLAAAQQNPPEAGPSLAELTAPRTVGKADAPIKVTEFFSLTCTHCAAFQRETFPQVKAKWIDPGKLQIAYHDFPLDRIALLAAMVARGLPPDRYEPFISALFASQDRWAFTRDANPKDELQKLALLDGMSQATFEAVVGNDKLKQFIMGEETEAENEYHVDSTPTFLCNGKQHAGEMGYEAFVKFVTRAAG
jgi:protein-disulfide isomerase